MKRVKTISKRRQGAWYNIYYCYRNKCFSIRFFEIISCVFYVINIYIYFIFFATDIWTKVIKNYTQLKYFFWWFSQLCHRKKTKRQYFERPNRFSNFSFKMENLRRENRMPIAPTIICTFFINSGNTTLLPNEIDWKEG